MTEESQGRPHADYEIHTHGNLEMFVRAVAHRLGWDASTDNHDVDPYETQQLGYTVRDPGRGDVLLTKGHHAAGFEYHLPEYARRLFADIESAIKGHEMDQDRRNRPDHQRLIVGGV